MREYYTYFHTRNDAGAVFYVGKGKDRRMDQFGRNVHWDRIASKFGYTAHKAMSNLTKGEALSHEIFLISCFKDIGIPLTNMTPGGDGMDSETAKKISAGMKSEGKGLFSRTKEEWSAQARISGKRGGRARSESGDLQKLALENCSKGGKAGGPIAAKITNSQRWKCLECEMVTTPGNISKHQTSKSHSGKEKL